MDNVYCPAVKAIREEQLLKDFPGRTETDLYLWLKKHQQELEREWKRSVPESDVAQDLSHQFGERFKLKLHRFMHRLFGDRVDKSD